MLIKILKVHFLFSENGIGRSFWREENGLAEIFFNLKH